VDCVSSPSSQGQWICTIPLMTSWKVAIYWPHEIRMIWYHTLIERGMRVACWSGFPCRVYIDSNHRDSRIWIPLICVSHHVDNLTNSVSLIVIDVVLLHTLNCLQLLYDYSRIYLSFEIIWIELKLGSNDSLLARVWHSIELILWSIAWQESAVYDHVDGSVLLKFSCSVFVLMLFYRCVLSHPPDVSCFWGRDL
jgi:hypothetical protein